MAKVPYEYFLEEIYGEYGQADLGQVFGDEVEFYQEFYHDYQDHGHLEQDEITP